MTALGPSQTFAKVYKKVGARGARAKFRESWGRGARKSASSAEGRRLAAPRWLLDAPIKLKRVSYGRFDAATMQAEVSELTPFETSIKMGLNDSTTK